MTNDLISAVRAHALAKKPAQTERALDKQDRLDQTYAPDAKKARQVVKEGGYHSLFLLATNIAKVTGEQKAKLAIQEATENFALANSNYMREEQREAANQVIDWMGAANGFMAKLPPGSPEHKVQLVEKWNAMLTAVNNATKVGVQKFGRGMPITLIADLESTALIIDKAVGNVDWG